jgi:hypothetical protein
MALKSINMSLVAWRKSPDVIGYEDFIGRLAIPDTDHYETLRPQPGVRKTVVIRFLSLSTDELPQSTEILEDFSKRLTVAFGEIAEWLAARPASVFEEFRKSGLQLMFLMNLWIDDNQLDLALPPEFLAACGRLGIKVSILSNE